MKVLAVIPARGGSKGVKDKNIRQLLGKPLLSYAIETAKNSDLVDKVVVNTDSDRIAKVAREYHTEVVFRTPEYGEDKASVVPVLIETLDILETRGEHYDLIVLLQVTSPLRTVKDLDNVVSMFKDNQAVENVVSVIKVDDSHPARMYQIEQDNSLQPYEKEGERKRRQELTPLYIRNGCFYAIRTETLCLTNQIISNKKSAYIMPADYALNIDTERDLLIAEVIMKEWLKKHNP